MSAGSILLVDDDLDVCEAYTEALTEAGYDVVSVNNGKEALAHLDARTRAPDVILVDLMMPIMDGWQLQRELSGRPGMDKVPLVVMSAGRKSEFHSAAAHLQKPISLDALLEAVARYCGGQAC